jgi:AcrR family transcriptional regulator
MSYDFRDPTVPGGGVATTRTKRPTRARARPEAPQRAPLTREAQKRRTREALMEAALRLMSEGRSFTGIGLREVAREAGVVPTAFYRHFRDMDELGLALVEEGGTTLRRLLREARRDGMPASDVIRASVRIYQSYLAEHPREFLFVASERSGGSPVIRAAVRREVDHFANEMAQDLRELRYLPHLSLETLQMICGVVVKVMLSAVGDILDLPPGQPHAEQELLDTFVRQMRLIFLGAAVWRDDLGGGSPSPGSGDSAPDDVRLVEPTGNPIPNEERDR